MLKKNLITGVKGWAIIQILRFFLWKTVTANAASKFPMLNAARFCIWWVFRMSWQGEQLLIRCVDVF